MEELQLTITYPQDWSNINDNNYFYNIESNLGLKTIMNIINQNDNKI